MTPAGAPSEALGGGSRLSGQPVDLAAVWPLLGRHIAFHRRLVHVTDSVKAALLLSQAIYWTRHGRDVGGSDGWFSKTAWQWEMETGLTEREQGGVRTILRDRQFLMEQRRGIPARLHYRLCAERLADALACRCGAGSPESEMLGDLLGPPLAYHRTLAGIGQGVHSGLMLSRALHLTRQCAAGDWIVRTTSQWTEDLGLTRREQEHARRVLSQMNLWEERRVGIPPRLAIRVRIDCLITLLEASAVTRASDARTSDLECPVRAGPMPRFVGSPAAESGEPVSTKPPSRIRRERHHGFDLTAVLQEQGSTCGESNLPHRSSVPVDPGAGEWGGELVYPASLQAGEREAANCMLRPVAPQAQALLDELAARIQANTIRSTPIAYLRGLVRRAAVGTFVPEAGLPITQARRQREAEERQRRAQAEADRSLAAERERPEYQRKLAERRAEMRRWLDASRRGCGESGPS